MSQERRDKVLREPNKSGNFVRKNSKEKLIECWSFNNERGKMPRSFGTLYNGLTLIEFRHCYNELILVILSENLYVVNIEDSTIRCM